MTDDHRNDATVAGTALGPDRGEVLWQPGPEAWETALGRFARRHGFDDYASLQAWSVADLDGFWRAVTDELGVRWHARPSAVLAERAMPGARWFPGGTLNYAEQALAAATERPGDVAVIARSQTRGPSELTWAELSEQVARAQAGLRRLGVGRGDRVVAYAPNIPETLVLSLATSALGAIWSTCAPEFGVRAVVDRFGWFSTTGWMMWNLLMSGLLAGSAVILFDGDPNHRGPATCPTGSRACRSSPARCRARSWRFRSRRS